MIKTIKKWFDCGDGFTAMINLKYDNKTKEVLFEEVVCTHEDVKYASK